MKRRVTFPKKFSRMILLAGALLWTFLVAGSLYLNWRRVEQATKALAAEEARSSFKKDLIFRLWNSKLGGVYVPVTSETPPNPYLENMEERDIFTPSGRMLTLINPAYMTRLVHKLGFERFRIRGHITSLKPIRPENKADEWETKALEAFQNGVEEVVSEEILEDTVCLRFMRPLVTEKNCLKCHAAQGYREGDIRGGISVSVPMSLYHTAATAGLHPLLLGHLVIWLLGLAGIVSGNMFLHHTALSRKAEMEHIAAEISSNFVRLAPGSMDQGVESAMGMIGELIGVDHVYLFQLKDADARWIKTYEWYENGTLSPGGLKQSLTSDDIPWIMNRLKKFRIIHITNVSELPRDVQKEVYGFSLQGIKGLYMVPLVLGDTLTGFLGADSIYQQVRGEENLIFLQLVGESIVHALDRDRSEKALTFQTERLDRILKGTNVGTWEWNVQTGEMIFNERWAEIIGYTLDSVSHISPEVLERDCHPDDFKGTSELLKRCFKRELEYYTCEMRVRHRNGMWVWVQDRGKVITWTVDGKPEWMYGTRTDINLRKRDELERQKMQAQLQQTQRLESLGVLAGGIAHDFNNILMGISGYADLALDDISFASPARNKVVEIINATKRAAELCSQMLAYAGKRQLEKRNISLEKLINDMANMLKASINKKNNLNIQFNGTLPGIHADVSQIRQILMNLVINASEAIGDESGIVTISTGSIAFTKDYAKEGYIVEPESDKTYVYLEVSDTGIGMDETSMQRLFEPFYTTKFTGRGLGLSAVLGIIRGHKGALRIQSDPGNGTVFRVLFPAVSESVDADSGTEVRNDWRGDGTVLLVDDEEAVRDVSEKMLRRLGLHIVTAKDGAEAVELYRSHQYTIDIVLLDMTMPHMNGKEALLELRKINPDVRVILASGYSEDDIASRFKKNEIVGCLQKPYTLEKLRSLLSVVMSETSPCEENAKNVSIGRTES